MQVARASTGLAVPHLARFSLRKTLYMPSVLPSHLSTSRGCAGTDGAWGQTAEGKKLLEGVSEPRVTSLGSRELQAAPGIAKAFGLRCVG